MKMEQTERSEMLAFKLQTPGKITQKKSIRQVTVVEIRQNMIDQNSDGDLGVIYKKIICSAGWGFASFPLCLFHIYTFNDWAPCYDASRDFCLHSCQPACGVFILRLALCRDICVQSESLSFYLRGISLSKKKKKKNHP
jgi:hypothetical protein